MAVVEGKSTVQDRASLHKTCIYKTKYSILGKDDHGSESMYMVTSCDTQVDQDFKCLCA